MTEGQFTYISTLVKNACGINLHDGKKELVKARLCKILRALKITDFDEYIERIANDPREMTRMLDSLSTNLTYFFRESQHFNYLREVELPALLYRNRQSRRLRLWSAGCSSGEEPYSMAVTVREVLASAKDWDVGILATDLSTRMLEQAKQATYDLERFREMPRNYLSQYFRLLETRPVKRYGIKEELRSMVTFGQLNLMGYWPMKGPFDVIFCRNVMIYFDKQTQARLIQRYWDILAPEGLLFVGHSESLSGINHNFEYVQPAIYRKPKRGGM